jgi:hypothetical protein
MNSRALKIACIIRWINANKGPTSAQLVIISPRCLSVDKATTFFKSFSKSAINPAKIIVTIPLINNIIKAELFSIKNLENRTTKNTPAVTSVDECTREEIGVGAAIAAGNQFLKGNWALLVKLPKISNKTKASGTKNIFSIKTLFLNIKLEKTIIRNPSPRRFVRAVFILALQEEEFWKNRTRKKEVTPKPSHPMSRAKMLLPKMKNTIDETKLIVKNKKRKISTSPFIYSLEKKRTDVTMIIKVLKNTIDKKSTTNLISKKLRKKNT